jgi:membrane associated rhomboid family serine protease
MELNHILLFLALVSPLAVLARAWRPGPTYSGWRLAAFAVLTVTALAWLLNKQHSGYIGGTAWFVLLFLPAIGTRRVAELSARHQFKSARRLATALMFLHPSSDLRHQVELLRTLESRQNAGLVSRSPLQLVPRKSIFWRVRNAPAVFALILINLAAFIPAIPHGQWNELMALHKLGALEPDAIFWNHQYWRLFTSLFLHAGWTHLLFNLFALFVLGPPLERAIGTTRFLFCYLLSGLGSTSGVVALWMAHITEPGPLVGASGCIMGIVGAWGAFLLLHQHMPMARQRLWNVVMIVAIQIAFDRFTPQVSMSAHLCGLVAGFIVGLIVTRGSAGSFPYPRDHDD